MIALLKRPIRLRVGVCVLIVLAAALLGCTPPGLRPLPDTTSGPVTARDKRLVKNVVVYYVCIDPPGEAQQTCGRVGPRTYAACTPGKRWPACGRAL